LLALLVLLLSSREASAFGAAALPDCDGARLDELPSTGLGRIRFRGLIMCDTALSECFPSAPELERLGML